MKRQFLVIPLLLFLFSFVFTPNSYAANCATDQDCEDNGSSLYGCAYESYKWYCQAAHPEITFCDSDEACQNDNTIFGCQSVGQPARWTCRATRTPAIGNGTNNIGPFCVPYDKNSGIRTALGCIKFSNDNASNDLITVILRIATGIGGGLALALILYGVFIVTTSAGMPDKLKAGSEIITSAIIGLIFILLSVFLVNFIGINILGIPGLS